MPNYREASATGTQWQRCNCVHIDNPLNGQAQVTFAEEVVATLGEELFIKPGPQIVFPFDPAEVIQLRNPQTGEVIPDATMTGLQVYVALFSLYLQKAEVRDAPPAAVPDLA